MLKELSIFGIYISPIFLYLAISALVWLAVRWLFQKLKIYDHVWHVPLFNTALYLLLLAGIFFLFNHTPRFAPVDALVGLLSRIFA